MDRFDTMRQLPGPQTRRSFTRLLAAVSIAGATVAATVASSVACEAEPVDDRRWPPTPGPPPRRPGQQFVGAEQHRRLPKRRSRGQ